MQELETTTESQLEQIDKLEQTLFELQGEIGGGRHIPPGVRVLSLRDNPASQWEDLSRKALERVKDENEALLKRLKELEESGVRGQAGNDQQRDEELVPRKSWEVLNERNEELQDELKQKDKRLLRLRQVRFPFSHPLLFHSHISYLVCHIHLHLGVLCKNRRIQRRHRIYTRCEVSLLP